jgi:hypothetical protein
MDCRPNGRQETIYLGKHRSDGFPRSPGRAAIQPDADLHALPLDDLIARQAAVVTAAELAGTLPGRSFMNERVAIALQLVHYCAVS